jgi:hypothetical protein
MGIELKTLIKDTRRQFERNFSARDLARLVSDCYHPDVLIVAEGHEGALRYFGWAIAAYYACCNNHRSDYTHSGRCNRVGIGETGT